VVMARFLGLTPEGIQDEEADDGGGIDPCAPGLDELLCVPQVSDQEQEGGSGDDIEERRVCFGQRQDLFCHLIQCPVEGFAYLVRQAKPGQSSNLKGGCHVKS